MQVFRCLDKNVFTSVHGHKQVGDGNEGLTTSTDSSISTKGAFMKISNNQITLNYRPKRRFFPIAVHPKFLDDFYEVKSIYAAIGDYYFFYRDMELTKSEKQHVKAMMGVANRAVRELPFTLKYSAEQLKRKSLYLPAAMISQVNTDWSEGIYVSVSEKGVLRVLRLICTEFHKAVVKKIQSSRRRVPDIPRTLVNRYKLEEMRDFCVGFLVKVNALPYQQYSDISDILDDIVHQNVDALWSTYSLAKKDGVSSFYDEPCDGVLMRVIDRVEAKTMKWDVNEVTIQQYEEFMNSVFSPNRLDEIFGLRIDLYSSPRQPYKY